MADAGVKAMPTFQVFAQAGVGECNTWLRALWREEEGRQKLVSWRRLRDMRLWTVFQIYRGEKKVREMTGAIKDDLEAMVASQCS